METNSLPQQIDAAFKYTQKSRKLAVWLGIFGDFPKVYNGRQECFLTCSVIFKLIKRSEQRYLQ